MFQARRALETDARDPSLGAWDPNSNKEGVPGVKKTPSIQSRLASARFCLAAGCGYTEPSSIDLEGVITGPYAEGNNVEHGFVRTPDGTIKTLDVPGTAVTIPVGINASGTIAGIYTNSDFVPHGFVFYDHRVE